MTGPNAPKQTPFLLGLMLVTGSVLALEVLDTRLLSVVTWYSLAFFVIAMALFGLTAGAVYVYIHHEQFRADALPTTLARAARFTALGVPASYVALLIVPLRTAPVATTVVLFLVFSLALALPFYPAGIVVAAALTRSRLPIGRVYAVDLIGAALGAAIVPVVLHVTDGGTAILSLGAISAIASCLFARSGGDQVSVRSGGRLAIGLAAVCIANASTEHGLVPLWTKGLPELHEHIERQLWNSHSRVTVTTAARVPATLWGPGARCAVPNVWQRDLIIDGLAATPLYLAPLDELGFLSCDVTNAAHVLRPNGPALVIGVGGSRDIQAALIAGHAPVVGIELNDRLLEVLKGPLGAPTGIAQRPDVTLVHDEARSFLTRHPGLRFELIQASLIDTWAATGAGAHALSENALYTVEAWRLFLQRLAPGGLFTVSRWSSVETARLSALAVGALLDSGITNPRDHLAMLSAGNVTTLILSYDPLSDDDERKLDAVASTRGFQIIVMPNRHTTAERLEHMLDAHTRAELDRIALLPELDFRPPTDDRPFFFNVIRIRTLTSKLPDVTKGAIEGNLLATRTLGLSFLASLILVTLGIAIPLSRRARTEHRASRSLWAAISYFAAIGVGFMLAEIALLERLSIVLGNPAYSLMVVLASLVGCAGLGSLISDRLPLTRAGFRLLVPLVIAAALMTVALAWPSIAPRVAASPTPARIAFAVAVCGPLGLLLGLAFPIGMRLCSTPYEDELPWLWGVNGMGSVLASSAAILIALELGLTTLLLVAAACYLLLVPAIWLIGARAFEPTNLDPAAPKSRA